MTPQEHTQATPHLVESERRFKTAANNAALNKQARLAKMGALRDALKHANCTVSGKDQPIEPPIEREQLSQDVDVVLNTLRGLARDAATERSYGLFATAGALIKEHQDKWSYDERQTAWAFFKYLRSALLTYLEDPHPYGALKNDANTWHQWISNGVQAGRQTERLSHANQTMRDVLQHCKVASGALVAPHVVTEDRRVPKHLSVPILRRQFNCPAWAAQRLQTLFLRYSADINFVRCYAQQAKERGYDAIFLELDFYSLQMAAVEPDPHDALSRNGSVTSYEEGRTELGRFANDPVAGYGEVDTDEETADNAEYFGYEAVEYHRVPSDADPLVHEYHHPLESIITSATRETLADAGKKLYELQKSGTLTSKVAGYLWHFYRIQEEHTMCPFMYWAINQIDQLTDRRALAKLGQEIYALKGQFSSNECKLFWAKYHAKKLELSGLAHMPAPEDIRFTLPDPLPPLAATGSDR